jgi:hypothetical protein
VCRLRSSVVAVAVVAVDGDNDDDGDEREEDLLYNMRATIGCEAKG